LRKFAHVRLIFAFRENGKNPNHNAAVNLALSFKKKALKCVPVFLSKTLKENY
jgi:hypothetical protein